MDELSTQTRQVRILGSMLTKLAAQDLERRLQMAGIEASVLQYAVMRRVSRSHATISELSGTMMLAPATLVPVVDALERKGLVVRGHNGHDRRRKELSLTPAGSDLLARFPGLTDDDLVRRGLAELGPEKARRFVTLLYELVSHMAPEAEQVDRALEHTVALRS